MPANATHMIASVSLGDNNLTPGTLRPPIINPNFVFPHAFHDSDGRHYVGDAIVRHHVVGLALLTPRQGLVHFRWLRTIAIWTVDDVDPF